jgi:hypothetical protein
MAFGGFERTMRVHQDRIFVMSNVDRVQEFDICGGKDCGQLGPRSVRSDKHLL